MNVLLHKDHRAVVAWLIVCALLVAAMVVVGGYTRLSGSGLSITSWKLIHGVVPPLDETEWQEEFDAYRASPQYEQVNRGMTLDEFKTIFWPEYFHRLLGRVIGLAFFIPLVAFGLRGSLTRRLTWRLIGIFALGGLQGIIGWLMVKSGLVDNPYVSHLRLALHLSMAFAILGLMVWTILDVILSGRSGPKDIEIPRQAGGDTVNGHIILPSLREGYVIWFTFLCGQIILGALVAGLHAGLIYNTYPTMNGQWIPDGLFTSEPWHENVTLVQFLHRNVAVVVALGFLLWWYLNRAYAKNAGLGKVCCGVAAVIAAQFVLGVLTLLHQVPLSLALLHQVTALLLFALAVVLLHGLAASGRTE